MHAPKPISMNIKKRHILILITALLSLQTPMIADNGAAAAEGPPFKFTDEQRGNRFYSQFKSWAIEDEIPRRNATLCVGSSSMRGWRTIAEDLAPLEILHRGFGGSRMTDVLVFQDFFNRYEAERIIVYEGDNDLARSSNIDGFIDQCKAFVESVHSVRADTEIYFLAIKPSVRRANRTQVFGEANARLEAFCASDERLFFIDVFSPMLDEDGNPRAELMANDQLHLNEEAYALWTQITREALGLDPLDAR
jgi:hypothetical protein